MKISKYLAAAILAASFAASANAQTKIYITGSTAFRSATSAAITTLLGFGPTAFTGTSANGANAQTWAGGSVGGNAVTIKTSWSGSNAGVQTTAQNTFQYQVFFFDDAHNLAGSGQADPRSGGSGTEAAQPDIAMVDNAQSSSVFNGSVKDVNNVTVAYSHLVDSVVGVIPFQFVASKNFPAGLSMTSNAAQYLYGSGVIPLAFWTGANADETAVVYADGRDTDSGTRVNSFAETGIGIFSPVQQYKPTISTGHITALNLYPVQTINGISTNSVGNSGESSGGTLAGYMGNVLDASAYDPNAFGFTAGYLMIYVGVSDAVTAITNGGVPLKWNGVDFSVTAVQEGSYTFWGYEHIMWKSTIPAGPKATFATNLKNQILATTQANLTPKVSFGSMQVSRLKEGTPINANYF